MPNRMVAQPWARQLTVAVTYGAGYSLLHDVVLSQYSLSFGLRLALLALTPYRYWAALVLGETISCGIIAIACMDDFGATWALLRALPMIWLVLPVVYLCRERLRLFNGGIRASAPVLVLAALGASLVAAPFQVGLVFTVAHLSASHPPPLATFGRFFLQNYVGSLTVAPLLVCLRETLPIGTLRTFFRALFNERLFVESIALLMPMLAFFVWLGFQADAGSAVRNIVQVATFMPVVALALRHGWHGAAIGGTGAGLAVEALMVSPYDPAGMQAQAVIALSVSTMLLMGTHITALNQREQSDRAAMRNALATAQLNYHLGEQQFRRVAQALVDMQRAMFRTLRFGRQLSPAEGLEYDRVTRPIVKRLDVLSRQLDPLPTIERSLPIALRESVVAEVLNQHGVVLTVDFSGGVSTLTFRMQLVLFRLISDAVAHLCERQPLARIAVSVRGRRYKGRTWISLRLDGEHDANRAVSYKSWHELVVQLAQHSRTRELAAIDATARMFEGMARVRAQATRTRLSAVVAEPILVDVPSL